MDSRRIAAIASLGLVGAVVVALIATSDDDTTSATDATAAVDAAVQADTPTTAGGADVVDRTLPTTAVANATTPTAPAERNENPDTPDLPDRGEHPPLIDIDGWQQSNITTLEELRGKVVAVQFWTFGCSNCKATIPHMQALYEKYGGGDDFEIVGVHAPEFDFERDPDAIAQAADDLGVTWPIALDTEKGSFRSWQTDRRFWPRLYLLDQDGHIRYDKIGEGKYDEIDAAVGALIAEGDA